MALYKGSLTAIVCCREHPDVPLIEDFHAGDMICSLCGLVVGDRVIDESSEWLTFKGDTTTKDKSRVGSTENPLLDGSDMTTMVVIGSDTFRDEIGYSKFRSRRTMSSYDRILHCAFKEIAQMSDRLNLPKVLLDQANFLYKQVHSNRSMKNHNFDAVVSACVYIACRQERVPRTFKEICAVTRVSRKKIGHVFKMILNIVKTKIGLVTSDDLMSRFCSKLSLSQDVQNTGRYIAKTASDMQLVSGRTPVSVAAAAIYMASQASDTKKTTTEISEVAGVTPKTILQIYNLMYPKAAYLFPIDLADVPEDPSTDEKQESSL